MAKYLKSTGFKGYFLAGVLVVVPAWGTFLILETLFETLDHLLVDVLGPMWEREIPGLGIVSLIMIIILVGMITTHLVGQRLLHHAELSLDRIPIVRSIYNTFKGMTDVFKFRERFGRSAVVVFPFPREGLWALGFVMGLAPPLLQISPEGRLIMVFVPTAIHPFTGYLAFVSEEKVRRLGLRPHDAMKMEFSAGLYHPKYQWLKKETTAHEL